MIKVVSGKKKFKLYANAIKRTVFFIVRTVELVIEFRKKLKTFRHKAKLYNLNEGRSLAAES